jgi:hypothetical protein
VEDMPCCQYPQMPKVEDELGHAVVVVHKSTRVIVL